MQQNCRKKRIHFWFLFSIVARETKFCRAHNRLILQVLERGSRQNFSNKHKRRAWNFANFAIAFCVCAVMPQMLSQHQSEVETSLLMLRNFGLMSDVETVLGGTSDVETMLKHENLMLKQEIYDRFQKIFSLASLASSLPHLFFRSFSHFDSSKS